MRRPGGGRNGRDDQPAMEGGERRYKGVRRRRWGKWVSEVRVPGTRERLWLGSYTTPEAAAVAYDTALFFLRGPSSTGLLNFPGRLPSSGTWVSLSPTSIQRVASDAGMDIDAELVARMPSENARTGHSAEAATRREYDTAYQMNVSNELVSRMTSESSRTGDGATAEATRPEDDTAYQMIVRNERGN